MASLEGACPCATVIAASAISVNGNAAYRKLLHSVISEDV